jgi:hypothetical protein
MMERVNLRYIISTFVNITMYPSITNNMIIKKFLINIANILSHFSLNRGHISWNSPEYLCNAAPLLLIQSLNLSALSIPSPVS